MRDRYAGWQRRRNVDRQRLRHGTSPLVLRKGKPSPELREAYGDTLDESRQHRHNNQEKAVRPATNVGILCAILIPLLGGCGGGQEDIAAARESPLTNAVALSVAGLPCAGCAFGPVTYVRQERAPTIERALVAGDPGADYVIEIDDSATQGADGSVTLDGVVLLAPRSAGDTGPRRLSLNAKLQAQSVLDVRLTGRPGATLTITIRAGARIVGTDGGSVTAPGALRAWTSPQVRCKCLPRSLSAQPRGRSQMGIWAQHLNWGRPALRFRRL